MATIANDLAKVMPSFKSFLEREASIRKSLGAVGGNIDILSIIIEGLNIISKPKRDILIVIDGLHKIGKQGDRVRDEFIRDLNKLVEMVPEWVRFVVTRFMADDENNRNIVDEIVGLLVDKSGGNMLWVKISLDLISDECFDSYEGMKLFVEKELPGGLDNLILSVLEKGFVDADEGVLVRYKKVMGVIVCSSDPLDQAGIAKLAGLTIGETGGIVLRIKSLLSIRDGRVHVIHKSFKDFLTSSDRCPNPAFYIDVSMFEYLFQQ
ncbi:hypothetical protein HDU76_005913 [Blyttiomyces sp. JEL0837]|nr:hypothetical protein HDU76_005913 [Blyttiomyces sp. JEL0837]